MVGASDGSGPAPQELIAMLATSRFDAARAVVERPDGRERSALVAVARADILVRTRRATVHDIDALRLEFREIDAVAVFRDWVELLLAELYFWDGDPLAATLAAQIMARTQDVSAESLGSMVRGRARRIVAIGLLLMPGAAAVEAARAEIARSIDEMDRAGWKEEGAWTSGLFGVTYAALRMHDLEYCVGVVSDAVDELRALGSPRLGLALCGLAHVAFHAGQMHVVSAALEESRSAPSTHPAEIAAIRSYLEAMRDVIAAGASDATCASLNEVVHRFRAELIGVVGPAEVTIAQVMLDLGQPDVAREWLGRAQHTHMWSPFGVFDRETVEARLDLIDHADYAAVGQVIQTRHRMHAAGLHREAGVFALRVAGDLERAGHLALARLFWGIGVREVSPPRTIWEALKLERARPGQEPGNVAVVRVLRGRPGVMRRGEDVRLAPGSRRLLAVLALARRPLPVDELADHMWPEIDMVTGRRRLNVALHRLRADLGPDGTDAVERTADGVRLAAPPGWLVDAWELLDTRNASPERDLRAYALFDGLPDCGLDLESLSRHCLIAFTAVETRLLAAGLLDSSVSDSVDDLREAAATLL